MSKFIEAINSPWKISNLMFSWIAYIPTRLVFAFNGIAWGKKWHFYGVPIIQKHRESVMSFGSHLQLRSSVRSNPLGPSHPVFLCTWDRAAILQIGDNFAMTGGSICAAEQITIGNNVAIGANCIVADTDFHPLTPEGRNQRPQEGNASPIVIEDDVFIGMNCLILKGVKIGCGSVIGAGSVVTHAVPPHVIAAGNPARIIQEL